MPYTRKLKVRESYYNHHYLTKILPHLRYQYAQPKVVSWINIRGLRLYKAEFDLHDKLKLEVHKKRIVITVEPES